MTSTSEPSARTSSEENGGGIGADAARSHGVFTGPFDAELVAVANPTAEVTSAVLRNLGSRQDTYHLVVDPEGSASVMPSSVTLAPLQTATVRINRTGQPTTVRVLSRGRGGEDIADLSLE